MFNSFGNNSNPVMFGQPQQQPNTGSFLQNNASFGQNPTSFGQNQTTLPFQQNTTGTNLFNQSQAQQPQQTNTMFGQPNPTQGSGMFGQGNAQNNGNGMFGAQTQQTSNMFGGQQQQNSNVFAAGQQQMPNTFGNQQPANQGGIFGQQPQKPAGMFGMQSNPLGGQTNTNTLGQGQGFFGANNKPQTGVFGQPAQNVGGFGSATANTNQSFLANQGNSFQGTNNIFKGNTGNQTGGLPFGAPAQNTSFFNNTNQQPQPNAGGNSLFSTFATNNTQANQANVFNAPTTTSAVFGQNQQQQGFNQNNPLNPLNNKLGGTSWGVPTNTQGIQPITSAPSMFANPVRSKNSKLDAKHQVKCISALDQFQGLSKQQLRINFIQSGGQPALAQQQQQINTGFNPLATTTANTSPIPSLPSFGGSQNLANAVGNSFFGAQSTNQTNLFAKSSTTPTGTGMFGAQGNTFGTQPNTFGTQPNTFGTQPNAFGTQPNTFGTQPNSFGAQGNMFGVQSNNTFGAQSNNTFGTQPNTFGAQPNNNFGALPGMFGAQNNTLGTQPNTFGTQPNTFGTQPNTFGAQGNTFGAQPNNAFGAQPSMFGTQPNTFGTQPNTFGTQPNTFGTQPNLFTNPANTFGAQNNAFGNQLQPQNNFFGPQQPQNTGFQPQAGSFFNMNNMPGYQPPNQPQIPQRPRSLFVGCPGYVDPSQMPLSLPPNLYNPTPYQDSLFAPARPKRTQMFISPGLGTQDQRRATIAQAVGYAVLASHPELVTKNPAISFMNYPIIFESDNLKVHPSYLFKGPIVVDPFKVRVTPQSIPGRIITTGNPTLDNLLDIIFQVVREAKEYKAPQPVRYEDLSPFDQLVADARRELSMGKGAASLFTKHDREEIQQRKKDVMRGIYRSHTTYRAPEPQPKDQKLKIICRGKPIQQYQQQQPQPVDKQQQKRRISANILRIKMEARRKYAAKEQELPKIGNFEIQPSLIKLKNTTASQLKNIPKCILSNTYGQIEFLQPVSLYKLDLARTIILAQDNIQILNEELDNKKVRYTFNNFGRWKSLNQQQRRIHLKKMHKWLQKMRVKKFTHCTETGKLVVQVSG